MSIAAAVAFMDRVETDDAFAAELAAHQDDPAAVFNAVRAAGFDVTPEEVKMAMLARYGAELSTEQLEALAGGAEDYQANVAIALGAAGVVVALAASAAAAF